MAGCDKHNEGGCMKSYRVEKESGGLAAQIERLQREIAELREAAQAVVETPNRESIDRLRSIL
jgi:outer membrane murein-binding lipoprotein Lpp